jgi:hypothetical protein
MQTVGHDKRVLRAIIEWDYELVNSVISTTCLILICISIYWAFIRLTKLLRVQMHNEKVLETKNT